MDVSTVKSMSTLFSFFCDKVNVCLDLKKKKKYKENKFGSLTFLTFIFDRSVSIDEGTKKAMKDIQKLEHKWETLKKMVKIIGK